MSFFFMRIATSIDTLLPHSCSYHRDFPINFFVPSLYEFNLPSVHVNAQFPISVITK